MKREQIIVILDHYNLHDDGRAYFNNIADAILALDEAKEKKTSWRDFTMTEKIEQKESKGAEITDEKKIKLFSDLVGMDEYEEIEKFRKFLKKTAQQPQNQGTDLPPVEHEEEKPTDEDRIRDTMNHNHEDDADF